MTYKWYFEEASWSAHLSSIMELAYCLTDPPGWLIILWSMIIKGIVGIIVGKKNTKCVPEILDLWYQWTDQICRVYKAPDYINLLCVIVSHNSWEKQLKEERFVLAQCFQRLQLVIRWLQCSEDCCEAETWRKGVVGNRSLSQDSQKEDTRCLSWRTSTYVHFCSVHNPSLLGGHLIQGGSLPQWAVPRNTLTAQTHPEMCFTDFLCVSQPNQVNKKD